MKHTKCLINVCCHAVSCGHSTITSDGRVSGKWSSVSRKMYFIGVFMVDSGRLVCPKCIRNHLILKVVSQHVNFQ